MVRRSRAEGGLPGLDSGPHAARRRSDMVAPAPFIGREAECAWLEAGLGLARAGRPQLHLVFGDAGIGKTRLVRELEGLAEQAGVRTWRGRGREGVSSPYLLFESMLRRSGSGEGEGGALAPLQRLLDSEGRSALPEGLAAEPDRLRLLQAVSTAVLEGARRQPTLIVLEDLHWADPASADLLAHLAFSVADASEPTPLMIACTLRPGEGGDVVMAMLARLEREPICRRIELAGFGEVEVEALLRAHGVERPSRQLVGRIGRATEGNPLFVEEVLHALSRTGALVKKGDRWEAMLDPDQVELPQEVTLAIASRVAALGEACRETLLLAACMGDGARFDDLAAAAEAREAEVAEHVEQALGARLLVGHGDELRFSHPLIRQAVYTGASAVRRRRVHRRIAEALERRAEAGSEPDLQQLAHHWLRGHDGRDPARVVGHAVRAAEQASSMFASGDAARFFEAALEVAGEGGLSSAERAELHYRAALANYRNMDADPCLEHLEKAIGTYQELGDLVGLARAQVEQARTSFSLAAVPYGTLFDVSGLEQTLERLEGQEDELRGWICFTLSECYMHASQPDRAEAYGHRALELGRKLDDPRLQAAAHTGLANALSTRMAARDALSHLEESHRLGEQSRDAWVAAWSLQRMPLTLAWLGELDQAEAAQVRASELTRLTGDWGDHSLALGASVALAAVRGDFARAEETARDTMMMARRSGYPWGGVISLTAVANMRGLRGEWQEAHDAVDIFEEPGRVFAEPGPVSQGLAAVLRLRLENLAGTLDEDDRSQAENLSKVMMAMPPDAGTLGSFCTFVEVAQRTGDAELAARVAPAIELAAQEGVVFIGGGEFLLPRIRGVLAVLQGDAAAAVAHFEEGMRAARRAGARPDLARVQLALAELLMQPGGGEDAARARQLMAEAVPALRELGMRPALRAASGLAARLEIEVDPAWLTDGSGTLGHWEREVLASLARGFDEAECAEALLISRESVRRNKQALFAKIEVGSEVGAAAYAIGEGIAPAAELPALRLPRRDQAARVQVIFVSDIEGSTRLIQRLGDAEAQAVVQEHNRLVRAALREHRGSEIQHTGDGFIAAFDSAEDGLHCALEIQQRFARRNERAQVTPLRIRIGLHAGEPLPEEGRLFGVAMNLAARVCSHASAGQVLASEAIRGLYGGTGISFQSLGAVSLKGIEAPQLLHRVEAASAL